MREKWRKKIRAEMKSWREEEMLFQKMVWIQEDMEEQTDCADLHHHHHQPHPACLLSQLNISQQVPASRPQHLNLRRNTKVWLFQVAVQHVCIYMLFFPSENASVCCALEVPFTDLGEIMAYMARNILDGIYTGETDKGRYKTDYFKRKQH